MLTVAEQIAKDVARRNRKLARRGPVMYQTQERRDFELAIQRAMREEFEMLEAKIAETRKQWKFS